MCYFANCNPGQDNKMASRHFVNISVLAQSAPGRLLTDRCVDWILFIFFFPQELCPALPDCKRATRSECSGRREGLTNAKQFIKAGTKHLSWGREAANQGPWLVQQYVKRRWYPPQLWSCLGSSRLGWCWGGCADDWFSRRMLWDSTLGPPSD